MKLKHASSSVLAAFAMLLGACAPTPEAEVAHPTDYTAVAGYNSRAIWTTASYDAYGFPIFGYTYGRAIYGYTAAGAALFTFDSLHSGCYVPQWNPAPWYQGDQEYSSRHKRVAAPPQFPKGHRPAERPSGGMMAAIHRDPGAVFGGRPPRPNPLPDVPLPTRISHSGTSNSTYYNQVDDYWDNYWRDYNLRQHDHRPAHRPSHRPPHHRPSFGGGGSHHRPSFGGGGSHHRPSFGGGGSHHRPSFSGGGSHHGSSFGGGSSHHGSSFGGGSSHHGHGGGSHHHSRSDDSSKNFPPFFPGRHKR